MISAFFKVYMESIYITEYSGCWDIFSGWKKSCICHFRPSVQYSNYILFIVILTTMCKMQYELLSVRCYLPQFSFCHIVEQDYMDMPISQPRITRIVLLARFTSIYISCDMNVLEESNFKIMNFG